MKKLLYYFLLIVPFCSTIHADQYIVEFVVKDGVKKQISSYTIPDGKIPDTDNAYVLVTAEEYALLSDGTKWEANTTTWLKNSVNVSKVDTAITNKPKSDKEIIADLTARLDALEAKDVTP